MKIRQHQHAAGFYLVPPGLLTTKKLSNLQCTHAAAVCIQWQPNFALQPSYWYSLLGEHLGDYTRGPAMHLCVENTMDKAWFAAVVLCR